MCCLFLCPKGSIFQPKLTTSALPATLSRNWIPSPAFETYFKEEPTLLSDLLFSRVRYGHISLIFSLIIFSFLFLRPNKAKLHFGCLFSCHTTRELIV